MKNRFLSLRVTSSIFLGTVERKNCEKDLGVFGNVKLFCEKFSFGRRVPFIFLNDFDLKKAFGERKAPVSAL